jgi:hypothetical protein
MRFSTASFIVAQRSAARAKKAEAIKQLLGMVESGFLVITVFDRQIEYMRVYADTVIVARGETVTWGGKMPNVGKTEHLRITAVWMKQQGRWQQVARHANIVPQP